MRVDDALRVAGRAARVAHGGGSALVDLGVLEAGRIGSREELLVAQDLDVGGGGRELARVAVAHHDVALDGRELARDLGEQWDEVVVDEDEAVGGVVGDVRELLREQAEVERVEHRADGRHPEVGLEVLLGVPRERADAVPRLDAEAEQRHGKPVGALGDLGERGTPTRLTLEGHHLARAVDSATVPEHHADGQREVLHGRLQHRAVLPVAKRDRPERTRGRPEPARAPRASAAGVHAGVMPLDRSDTRSPMSDQPPEFMRVSCPSIGRTPAVGCPISRRSSCGCPPYAARGCPRRVGRRSRRSRRGRACGRRARPPDAPRSRGRRRPGRGWARRSGRRGTGTVERVRGDIDLDRLGELAHDGAVLLGDEVEAEHPALGHQLVGEGLALDAHPDQLRVERQLRDPVDGHAVASFTGTGTEHVEPARHLPEDTAAELVVHLRVLGGRDGTDDSLLGGHPRRLGLQGGARGRPPGRDPPPAEGPAPPTPRPSRRGPRRSGGRQRVGERVGADPELGAWHHHVDEPACLSGGRGDALAGDHRGQGRARARPLAAGSGWRRPRAACPHAPRGARRRSRRPRSGRRIAVPARTRSPPRSRASRRSSEPRRARRRPHTSRPQRASRIAKSDGAVPNSRRSAPAEK